MASIPSTVPVISGKVLIPFADKFNLAYFHKDTPENIVNKLNDAQGDRSWAKLFNWLFNEADIPSEFTLLLPNQIIKVKDNVKAFRRDRTEKPLTIKGAKRGTKSRIEFSINGGTCLEIRRTTKLEQFSIDGGDNHILKIEVDNFDDTSLDADTDSSIRNCDFKGFKNKRAVTFVGRNTKIYDCTFTDTPKGADSVGIWHYFKNIFEDDGRLGACRKNEISDNTFDINKKAYAIRLGASPDDSNGSDNSYSNYEQFTFDRNTVQSGRFLKVFGGRVGNNKQLFNLSIQERNVLAEDDDDDTTGVSILFEKCILNCNLTGTYNGQDKAKHAVLVSDNVDLVSLLVNGTFSDYKDYAVAVDKAEFRQAQFLGTITGNKGDKNGKNGVGKTNGGSLEDYEGNFMVTDPKDAIPDEPSVKNPGDVKLPEGKTLVISKIFKALNDRSSKFKYKKDYDGETFECDLYDEVFKAIANANKGDEFFAKRYLIDKKAVLTKPVVFNREVVFTAADDNNRNNIIAWSSEIGNNFMLTFNEKVTFQKVGFSSTGIDQGDYDDIPNHPWAGEKGCDLIDLKGNAGKAKFNQCGIAGHVNKTAIRWDVTKGKVNVQDCNFKDARGGVHVHMYSTGGGQKSSSDNIIGQTKFHTGGGSVPLLVGKYLNINSCSDLGDITMTKCIADIGSHIIGINTTNKVGAVLLNKLDIYGGLRPNFAGLDGSIDLQSGKLKSFEMYNCNLLSKSSSEIQNHLDYVRILKNVTIDNKIKINNCNFLIENYKNDSYCILVDESHLNNNTKRGNFEIIAGISSDKNQNVGPNGFRVIDGNQLNIVKDKYNTNSFGLYSITGTKT